LSDLLVSFKPYLNPYGYWAMFGAIMLGGFAVPMPGQTLLIVASFLASRGELHLVLFTGWIAAIGGTSIGYAIGRYRGRKLVLHYGHYLFLNWRRLEYVETFFRDHGKLLIRGARFLDGLRQLIGIVAGMAWCPGGNSFSIALWEQLFGLAFGGFSPTNWVKEWPMRGV
jgi:membrane protein DedA with SNARE-associated domain